MLSRESLKVVHFILIAVFAFSSLAYSSPVSRPQAEDAPDMSEQAVQVFEITRDRDFKKVQAILDERGTDPLLIKIAAGEYKLKRSLHINRSNVTVRGESGVLLKLANKAQTPVIAVGSQAEYPLDSERIQNIAILDLEIDGNREAQLSEYDRHLPWIRNNGIDVRTVTGLRVEGVRCGNNRSGGLVISWRCRDVLAKNCIFDNNYFDGVAYYDSTQVYTVDCDLRDNQGAGVSIDNAVYDALFSNCLIQNNQDVGVFARHSTGLMFYQSTIRNSGNWAFFLSHDDNENGVFNVEIASCSIEENNGGVRMGSVDTKQSSGNRVTLTSFAGNDAGGRTDLSTAGSPIDRLEAGWNPLSDGLVEGSRSVRPFSKRLYQALNKYDSLVGAPES
ncbi:right-handed parallel beta-helix repeat-containing protein [Pelagicoccus sp. SDUM812002]|uniref:right-handed parallel beta-helix repeat-containing protein n=1 Tax=Pelagicoccus sp. SDUM812002 TaxID=3041266 RepID=UPI00280DFF70|nr:right-handed parallel beta-helix repeat-containing protein [Pelagicoccus sp. SDUM812002]MDQ8187053.1 right-handed parallel beta-helix repeat-containing protein [Pelagicoccus sp. SDUM812002]